MVKAVFWLIGLAIALVTGYASYLATEAEQTHNRQLTVFFPSQIYIMNNAGKSVPLYASSQPNGEMIGRFNQGKYYPFSYAGKSGGWLYGSKIFIKDSNRIKIVLIGSYPLPLNVLKHFYLLGIMVLLLLIFISNKATKSKQHADDIKAMVEHERRERMHAEQQLSGKGYEINQLNQIIENQKSTMLEQQLEVEAHTKAKFESLISSFKEHERQLRHTFENDAKERERKIKHHIKVEISSIQNSYDTLNKQYQSLKVNYNELKAQGLTFDIDFDGKKYESLLKGRLYEINFAEKILTNADFEILSWTSDKGFENGISVRANGDPDFLIQYKKEFTFAVECKFRSQYYKPHEGEKRISWANTRQARRYTNYQKQYKVPVFVALGLLGEADNPEQEFLIKLDALIKVSEGTYWSDNDKNEQQVCRRAYIYNDYIKKDSNYAQKAIALLG